MLYDILPPLFLLGSFGGITVVISRVVMRVQRDRLSEDIRTAASRTMAAPGDELLRSENAKVHLVKNRLAFVPGVMRSMRDGLGGVLQRRKEGVARIGQATKTAVHSGVERSGHLASGIQSMAAKSKERLQQVRARRQKDEEEMNEAQVIVEEPVKKAVQVRRVELPVEESEETQALQDNEEEVPQQGVRALLSRKPAPEDPLKRAAVCLKQSQFDKAEDILLPYIVQHARDAKAYMLLGRAALGRGDWDEAIEIFQQVRAIDEDAPRLFSSLGEAAFEAGKFGLAVEALQKARDIEPENITIRQKLLTIARRMDNRVLVKSVSEELRELREHQTAAKA